MLGLCQEQRRTTLTTVWVPWVLGQKIPTCISTGLTGSEFSVLPFFFRHHERVFHRPHAASFCPSWLFSEKRLRVSPNLRCIVGECQREGNRSICRPMEGVPLRPHAVVGSWMHSWEANSTAGCNLLNCLLHITTAVMVHWMGCNGTHNRNQLI
ncbi:hypothetical protein FOXYSP1_06796 [Fusarium oxysporum f. sp. phaseoli]